MRRMLTATAAAVLVLAAPAAAATTGLPGGPNPPQPLTAFPAGSFPESLAVRGGDLFVSLGFAGEVVRLTSPFATWQTVAEVPRGDGLLTGLAFDGAGNLYVGSATFSEDPAPGVWRISPGGAVDRVLTLPPGSFPNGLAFRDGYVYVADSALGAIWRVRPGEPSPASPWYEDGLLRARHGLGANGLAFDASGDLDVVVAESGSIVRLTLGAGTVSASTLVTEQAQLRSADGIAVDAAGDLFVSVNDTNRLYRVTLPDGVLTRVADRSDGLSYPTQPAFDTTPGSTTLYLTNGAFGNGAPGIEAFDVGVAGLQLP